MFALGGVSDHPAKPGNLVRENPEQQAPPTCEQFFPCLDDTALTHRRRLNPLSMHCNSSRSPSKIFRHAEHQDMITETTSASRLRDIPRGVWMLGFVSMFMDISSEMIHALLPIYLVGVLGASALTVGLIEGVAEATAMITKIFSGAFSDRLGKRKTLAAFGYGLAAFTKPIFPLATSVGWLTAARFIDRVGKGIRGAPRDALVADLSPAELRGNAFGLRQSLDTVGAVLGPLAAIIFMAALANDFTAVFWIAVVPAFVSLAIIVFVVHEPQQAPGSRAVHAPLSRAELGRLGTGYWIIVSVAAIFTLARFTEAFLLLRAQAVGL